MAKTKEKIMLDRVVFWVCMAMLVSAFWYYTAKALVNFIGF